MSAELQTRHTRLRTAVIGCGWIGAGEGVNRDIVGVQSHAEAYASHARTQLSAVVDANLDSAEKAAKRWQAESFYDDPIKMIQAAQPEIVSICTPDALHANTILLMLENCPSLRAILAEKPLALTLAEARRVSAAAEQRGVVLAVNYSRRYCPAYRQLRAEIQSGALGAIQQVHGYYGKGLIHNGTHWIDLLRYLCGEISSLQALPLPVACADTPAISMILESGAVALLQPCRPEAFTLFEMDILAEQGRIRMLAGGLHIERHAVAKSPYFAGYRELLFQSVQERCMTDSIVHAVDDLITCLDETGRQPTCTAADATIALALAIQGVDHYQSLTL
jgi:predicted dehydrogenase